MSPHNNQPRNGCVALNGMQEPEWTDKCGSRRMQAMVEPYCPKKLAPKRILQAIVHPVAPACTNFNARRRLQAVVTTLKCPVNIEGIQCFKNNTNKKCEQPK